MSLRERMSRPDAHEVRRANFRKWGVLANPYPVASQTTGHPRLENGADDAVVAAFREFETSDRQSQVLLVEGTQGTGKTNLLNYYEEQFRDYYRDDQRYYIIRYYPDPEPDLDSVIRRTFRNWDASHFAAIGRALSEANEAERNAAKEVVRGHEVRLVLNGLQEAAGAGDLAERSVLAVEWFTGMRVLRRHREALGVSLRLDTKESRMQALRDVVHVSERLGLLRGIFLLMDELEKQDYSLSTIPVLRFLLAVRALIDALPHFLFLMLSMTVEARRRYFSMLPALAGRLENRVAVAPIVDAAEAVELAKFYLSEARERAAGDPLVRGTRPGEEDPLGDAGVLTVYSRLVEELGRRGAEGVTQRRFLHRLHDAWSEATGGGSGDE